MKLVLQCAMCGTHHPVGTPACSTCGASGVTQLRLMFECLACSRLDISPECKECSFTPFASPLDAFYDHDGLVIAEEVIDDEFAIEWEDLDLFGEYEES